MGCWCQSYEHSQQVAELAEWLVPSTRDRSDKFETFRYFVTFLGLFELQNVTIPPPLPWTSDHVLICIGRAPSHRERHLDRQSFIVYTHEESLNRLSSDEPLDFFAESDHECGFHLNLHGLLRPFLSEKIGSNGFERPCLLFDFPVTSSCDCRSDCGRREFGHVFRCRSVMVMTSDLCLDYLASSSSSQKDASRFGPGQTARPILLSP